MTRHSATGQESDVKSDVVNGLDATGNAIADAAGWVGDKTVAGAKATGEGAKTVGEKTVEVTSDKVGKPGAVRFGWERFPVVNLWNKAGLPASPFRTDDFPMITKPK